MTAFAEGSVSLVAWPYACRCEFVGTAGCCSRHGRIETNPRHAGTGLFPSFSKTYHKHSRPASRWHEAGLDHACTIWTLLAVGAWKVDATKLLPIGRAGRSTVSIPDLLLIGARPY